MHQPELEQFFVEQLEPLAQKDSTQHAVLEQPIETSKLVHRLKVCGAGVVVVVVVLAVVVALVVVVGGGGALVVVVVVVVALVVVVVVGPLVVVVVVGAGVVVVVVVVGILRNRMPSGIGISYRVQTE